MEPRHVRVTFGAVVVLLALSLVGSYATSASGITDRYEEGATVEPAPNTTVVTTSPRQSTDASIVAFAPDGSVRYYNETYDYYFDVDPVEGESGTVEYVAVEWFTDECAAESALGRGDPCSRSVVERLDLDTGETTRLYSYASRPVDIGGWHDVDRINATHLLVAGSVEDRVFIVDTTTDTIEWQWQVQNRFPLASGGRFPTDWAHVNDVEYLDDGRVLLSARNQDTVLFIDPGEGVQPSWSLGGDGRYGVLYEQHNPDYIPRERGGPALLVADSENNRIVEYQRTDGGAWTRTWTWQDSTLQWGRDADRLPNGHTLITDSNGNRVIEVNEQGEVVWSVPVDTPYEAERIGTGDESAGGHSARSLGLESRTVTGKGSADADTASPLMQAVVFVRELLPPIVANGLLFVLPPWVDLLDVLLGAALGGTLLAWGVAEFRWSAYRLRSPLERP
ncbi:arylsulfotransferase family protein [Halorarius halobius]|uniref:arylsulfotransferase family protein n=1 Tax=Halorarius halobius TaxID=2962671 RepID=UPI0020CEA98D|nr:arylsulfotransferase family protein [Halorarius halobius]